MTDRSKVWRKFFTGRNGLRAGWRMVIFFVLFLCAAYLATRLTGVLQSYRPAEHGTRLEVVSLMAPLAVALLLVSGLMAKFERRSLAQYGLPLALAFRKQFWIGAMVGFLSLTALVFTLHMFGALSLARGDLTPGKVVLSGAAWLVPAFLGALVEDFFYRGYFLFTLTTGIGFWPAAAVSSLWMGGMHYLNPGGHGLGPASALAYCLVTCLLLRRTGNLWMPLGVHSAWNWGEMYFYGTLDSGFRTHSHLFAASQQGPAWLSGGLFGPEASVLIFVMFGIWWLGFSKLLPEKKYPLCSTVPPRFART